ncbi:MAG TPA: EamA family transporter [Candidatus Angelobacter sp.]|nr:EamA family transporter [Candidatus Angelobacter sp.]
MKIETSSGRTPSRAAIAASICILVVVWAVNFIAAKIGLHYLPARAMASFRVVLAGAVMVPVYFACSRLPVFAEAAALRRRGFMAHDIWVFFYLGFFGVAVNQTCFTVGLEYTSVSHAAVIVGLGPIYILVLAVVFRMERATGHKVVGMLIALIGIAVLASENGISFHSPSLAGDAITMTGSMGLAIYVVLGKRVAGKYDSLSMTAFNHFAGAILLLPVAILEARNLVRSPHWPFPWQAWAAVLYMAVFSSALAYVFYFWLLRYLEASQLSAFTYLLPVLATILGIWWLGEKGSWVQVLGGLLALGGVYWIESGRTATAKDNSAS